MDSDNPSILSHVSLGTQAMNNALVFYDAVLATVGAHRQQVIELDPVGIVAVAYGRKFPEFWIQIPDSQNPASVGNGVHVAFNADNIHSVNQFHQAALANGGSDEGAPGPRPHYGEAYYGCFVRDPDGNKIEAMFWDTTKVINC